MSNRLSLKPQTTRSIETPPPRRSLPPYRTAYASPPANATPDELLKRLKDALRMLQEKEQSLEQKDNDLVMAAELGSSLLEDNERLRLECARLLEGQKSGGTASLGSTASRAHENQRLEENDHTQDLRPSRVNGEISIAYASPTQTIHSPLLHAAEAKRRAAAVEAVTAGRIADLESTIMDLQAQVEKAHLEARAAQESDRAHERKSLQLETEMEVVSKDLATALTRCQELEEDKKKLVKDKADLARKVKESGDRDKDLEEIMELRDRTRALEEVVVQMTHARAELEAELAVVGREHELTSNRCEELEAMMEDFRGESEVQMSRNDDLQWELETARDLAAKLEARLAVLEPRKDGVEDVGDRTLFSEVEDKRQALENKHVSLSQKHAGLMKAHSMSISQQERMRSHISRLTQLSNHREGEMRIRLLEEALGQSESERQELQHTISMLEKERAADADVLGNVGSGRSHDGAQPADYEVELECLRLRIAQLTTEHDEGKAELRTLKMLKSFETEKLRSVESLLREREDELQRLKTINAQIKFDLEQAKDKIRQQRGYALRRQSLEGNTSVVSDDSPILAMKSVATQTLGPNVLQPEPHGVTLEDDKGPRLATSPLERKPIVMAEKENGHAGLLASQLSSAEISVSSCSSTAVQPSQSPSASTVPQPRARPQVTDIPSQTPQDRVGPSAYSPRKRSPLAPLAVGDANVTERQPQRPNPAKTGPTQVFVPRKQPQNQECAQQ